MALQASGQISLGDIQTEFGGTNPIAISEYYGVGSGTPLPLGLTPALFTVSGNSTSGWTSRTIDISAYEGYTVRPVFLHSGMTDFTSDLQLDLIGFNASALTTGLEDFETSTSVNNWQTSSTGNTADYPSVSWFTLGSTIINGRWCRDSGGTSSSGTGLTTAASGSWYVYTETSSYFSGSYKYWLRGTSSTTITSSNNRFKFWEARSGAGMGTLTAYLDIVAQPTIPGTPTSGTIRLSDFYGLAAPTTTVATATLTPAYDGSLESVYTFLTNDRRGFGVDGKNDFYYPESVGTTYDDGFGSLTNASGLIVGAGVTSIAAVDVSSGGNDHIILQAQGSNLSTNSVTYLKISGFFPVTSTNVTVTLQTSDSRCFTGVPTRLAANGIPNMFQWVWVNSTVPEASITTAVSIINHAAANGLTVSIEIESQ